MIVISFSTSFSEAWNFIKKESLAQVFYCQFCEISKNTSFTEQLWATAFAQLWNDFVGRLNLFFKNETYQNTLECLIDAPPPRLINFFSPRAFLFQLPRLLITEERFKSRQIFLKNILMLTFMRSRKRSDPSVVCFVL